MNHRIWRLTYGPCWCQGIPAGNGAFDFVRMTISEPRPGPGVNFLVVSNRVLDGSRAAFLSLHEEIPQPRWTIGAATCPAAEGFWDGLPIGWAPVQEVIPVDVQVGVCITGRPDALVTAVLDLLGTTSDLHALRATGSPDPVQGVLAGGQA